MLVKLKGTWFAPTAAVQKDKIQTVSGRRFRKGVQDIPEELIKHLPSSAVLLEKPEPVIEQEEVVKTLREVDTVRKAEDDVHERIEKALEDAEAAKLEIKRKRMAHAREHINK
jgi:hypothetical protein